MSKARVKTSKLAVVIVPLTTGLLYEVYAVKYANLLRLARIIDISPFHLLTADTGDYLLTFVDMAIWNLKSSVSKQVAQRDRGMREA